MFKAKNIDNHKNLSLSFALALVTLGRQSMHGMDLRLPHLCLNPIPNHWRIDKIDFLVFEFKIYQ